MISQLSLEKEPCVFRGPVPLFCETQDGLIRFCITVSVYKIQGDFENLYFLDPLYIYEVSQQKCQIKISSHIKVHAESSGALKIFFRGMVLEIRLKLMIF